jgi:apolipoprotein N-acyltransferase
VSFVVDPDGQIHDETALYTKVERVVKVPLARVDTFYELWGNWFVGACGATLAFLWATRRAKA